MQATLTKSQFDLYPSVSSGAGSFWLRRVHSLIGIFPLGFFLMAHVWGTVPLAWRGGVPTGTGDAPLWENLFFMGAVLLPLLFHAGYGLYLLADARFSGLSSHHVFSVRRTVQRVLSILTLVFLIYHLLPLMMPNLLSVEKSSLSVLFQYPQKTVVECVGGAALMLHFWMGLWTAALTWGLFISDRAQRRLFWICVAGGMLSALGVIGIFLQRGGGL